MFRTLFPKLRCRAPVHQAGIKFWSRWWLCLLACTPFSPAHGQELTAAFIAPARPLTAASRESLWLYCMNNSGAPVQYSFPAQLEVKLISAAGTNQAVLALKTKVNAGVGIAPGAFARAEYSLAVPALPPGRVCVEVAGYNQFFADVVANVPNAIAGTGGGTGGLTTNRVAAAAASPTRASASSKMETFFDDHMYRYEPIYFLVGTYPAAEFQVSLKYKVLNGTSPDNPLGNLYFAYTQTSYWDLLSPDPSFYDTSYKPSAFLYYTNVLRAGFPVKLDLQGGIEHESNGRGGAAERSLNTVYLQPTLYYDLNPHLTLTLRPRVWYYLSKGDNDQDLENYRGYADLYAALTWQSQSWERIQLSSKLRVGDVGWHTGEEVDLIFFLPEIRGYHFNPAVQVQYFSGYGQTLRQYNQISHGLRAGLCLSF